jgi:hypothetical protein
MAVGIKIAFAGRIASRMPRASPAPLAAVWLLITALTMGHEDAAALLEGCIE